MCSASETLGRRQRSSLCAASGAVECVEGGVVGVGEGVQVFFSGAQAAVAEAFFDGLDVGSAGE